MASKNNPSSISDSTRGLLTSGLVIVSGVVIALNFILYSWPPLLPVAVGDVVYILFLLVSLGVLSGRLASSVMRVTVIVICAAVTGTAIWLAWGYISFMQHFRW